MEMSESKGVEDMCTALEELKKQGIEQGRQEGRLLGRREGREQGRQEGRTQGRQEGKIYGAIAAYRDFDMPEEEISKKLQIKFGVTPEEAEQYLSEQQN